MPTLFDPLQAGDLHLPNRIVMAPLTRCRAEPGRVPGALIAQYYVQRASAGLIISEATSVTPLGVGYPDTPGIWSEEQVRGWKNVTDAVHAAGGRIVLQLWHVGRISDPCYLDGQLPVAPSAIQPKGHVSLVRPIRDYVTRARWKPPRFPASSRPIARARPTPRPPASTAWRSMPPTATCSTSSSRTAPTSAATPTAARWRTVRACCWKVTDACVGVWGAGRVGVHLAPRADAHDMGDSDRATTFGYVARELGKRGIAFLCTREHEADDSLTPQLKEAFGGVVIANERFDKAQANRWLAEGKADAVAFGVPFIANPDLPARLAADAPLNQADSSTFYASGPVGYLDYPTL